ncbi:splicing factor, proline- and glutamine-rich-like [Bubalus kerabau]|uniref:splicing factor, proline- and glutamine-rich-like n=1 Tax=Bubalus carabanensis TaxID=3119969 RepID=UPI00244EAF12|nr:splicing factor, proline- and glutamine-rich-like [Bubalus carabanensis]
MFPLLGPGRVQTVVPSLRALCPQRTACKYATRSGAALPEGLEARRDGVGRGVPTRLASNAWGKRYAHAVRSTPPRFLPQQRAEGGGGGGGRGHRVATPPEPAFSRAAAGGSPPAAQLASQGAQGSGPALHSAPPPPRRSPSFGCSQRRSAPSAPPPRTPAPGSRLSAPGSGPYGSGPGPAPPAPSPTSSPGPAPLPGPALSLSVSALRTPSIPPSLFCLLARSLALRRGEAASQENPRNLCKQLTMKFKKFFDFGAIFEWIERQPRTFISINPKSESCL